MIMVARNSLFIYIFFPFFGYHLVATAALRRKKMHETDLDKLSGMRLQAEMQVNTLESANMNANMLDSMRRGANALRDIHNGLCVLLHTSHTSILSYTNSQSLSDFLPISISISRPRFSCSAGPFVLGNWGFPVT